MREREREGGGRERDRDNCACVLEELCRQGKRISCVVEAKGEGQCKVKVNTMGTMDVCAEHVVRYCLH